MNIARPEARQKALDLTVDSLIDGAGALGCGAIGLKAFKNTAEAVSERRYGDALLMSVAGGVAAVIAVSHGRSALEADRQADRLWDFSNNNKYA